MSDEVDVGNHEVIVPADYKVQRIDVRITGAGGDVSPGATRVITADEMVGKVALDTFRVLPTPWEIDRLEAEPALAEKHWTRHALRDEDVRLRDVADPLHAEGRARVEAASRRLFEARAAVRADLERAAADLEKMKLEVTPEVEDRLSLAQRLLVPGLEDLIPRRRPGESALSLTARSAPFGGQHLDPTRLVRFELAATRPLQVEAPMTLGGASRGTLDLAPLLGDDRGADLRLATRDGKARLQVGMPGREIKPDERALVGYVGEDTTDAARLVDLVAGTEAQVRDRWRVRAWTRVDLHVAFSRVLRSELADGERLEVVRDDGTERIEVTTPVVVEHDDCMDERWFALSVDRSTRSRREGKAVITERVERESLSEEVLRTERRRVVDGGGSLAREDWTRGVTRTVVYGAATERSDEEWRGGRRASAVSVSTGFGVVTRGANHDDDRLDLHEEVREFADEAGGSERRVTRSWRSRRDELRLEVDWSRTRPDGTATALRTWRCDSLLPFPDRLAGPGRVGSATRRHGLGLEVVARAADGAERLVFRGAFAIEPPPATYERSSSRREGADGAFTEWHAATVGHYDKRRWKGTRREAPAGGAPVTTTRFERTPKEVQWRPVDDPSGAARDEADLAPFTTVAALLEAAEAAYAAEAGPLLDDGRAPGAGFQTTPPDEVTRHHRTRSATLRRWPAGALLDSVPSETAEVTEERSLDPETGTVRVKLRLRSKDATAKDSDAWRKWRLDEDWTETQVRKEADLEEERFDRRATCEELTFFDQLLERTEVQETTTTTRRWRALPSGGEVSERTRTAQVTSDVAPRGRPATRTVEETTVRCAFVAEVRPPAPKAPPPGAGVPPQEEPAAAPTQGVFEVETLRSKNGVAAAPVVERVTLPLAEGADALDPLREIDLRDASPLDERRARWDPFCADFDGFAQPRLVVTKVTTGYELRNDSDHVVGTWTPAPRSYPIETRPRRERLERAGHDFVSWSALRLDGALLDLQVDGRGRGAFTRARVVVSGHPLVRRVTLGAEALDVALWQAPSFQSFVDAKVGATGCSAIVPVPAAGSVDGSAALVAVVVQESVPFTARLARARVRDLVPEGSWSALRAAWLDPETGKEKGLRDEVTRVSREVAGLPAFPGLPPWLRAGRAGTPTGAPLPASLQHLATTPLRARDLFFANYDLLRDPLERALDAQVKALEEARARLPQRRQAVAAQLQKLEAARARALARGDMVGVHSIEAQRHAALRGLAEAEQRVQVLWNGLRDPLEALPLLADSALRASGARLRVPRTHVRKALPFAVAPSLRVTLTPRPGHSFKAGRVQDLPERLVLVGFLRGVVETKGAPIAPPDATKIGAIFSGGLPTDDEAVASDAQALYARSGFAFRIVERDDPGWEVLADGSAEWRGRLTIADNVGAIADAKARALFLRRTATKTGAAVPPEPAPVAAPDDDPRALAREALRRVTEAHEAARPLRPGEAPRGKTFEIPAEGEEGAEDPARKVRVHGPGLPLSPLRAHFVEVIAAVCDPLLLKLVERGPLRDQTPRDRYIRFLYRMLYLQWRVREGNLFFRPATDLSQADLLRWEVEKRGPGMFANAACDTATPRDLALFLDGAFFRDLQAMIDLTERDHPDALQRDDASPIHGAARARIQGPDGLGLRLLPVELARSLGALTTGMAREGAYAPDFVRALRDEWQREENARLEEQVADLKAQRAAAAAEAGALDDELGKSLGRWLAFTMVKAILWTVGKAGARGGLWHRFWDPRNAFARSVLEALELKHDLLDDVLTLDQATLTDFPDPDDDEQPQGKSRAEGTPRQQAMRNALDPEARPPQRTTSSEQQAWRERQRTLGTASRAWAADVQRWRLARLRSGELSALLKIEAAARRGEGDPDRAARIDALCEALGLERRALGRPARDALAEEVRRLRRTQTREGHERRVLCSELDRLLGQEARGVARDEEPWHTKGRRERIDRLKRELAAETGRASLTDDEARGLADRLEEPQARRERERREAIEEERQARRAVGAGYVYSRTSKTEGLLEPSFDYDEVRKRLRFALDLGIRHEIDWQWLWPVWFLQFTVTPRLRFEGKVILGWEHRSPLLARRFLADHVRRHERSLFVEAARHAGLSTRGGLVFQQLLARSQEARRSFAKVLLLDTGKGDTAGEFDGLVGCLARTLRRELPDAPVISAAEREALIADFKRPRADLSEEQRRELRDAEEANTPIGQKPKDPTTPPPGAEALPDEHVADLLGLPDGPHLLEVPRTKDALDVALEEFFRPVDAPDPGVTRFLAIPRALLDLPDLARRAGAKGAPPVLTLLSHAAANQPPKDEQALRALLPEWLLGGRFTVDGLLSVGGGCELKLSPLGLGGVPKKGPQLPDWLRKTLDFAEVSVLGDADLTASLGVDIRRQVLTIKLDLTVRVAARLAFLEAPATILAANVLTLQKGATTEWTAELLGGDTWFLGDAHQLTKKLETATLDQAFKGLFDGPRSGRSTPAWLE